MSVPAAVRHRWGLDGGGRVTVIDLGDAPPARARSSSTTPCPQRTTAASSPNSTIPTWSPRSGPGCHRRPSPARRPRRRTTTRPRRDRAARHRHHRPMAVPPIIVVRQILRDRQAVSPGRRPTGRASSRLPVAADGPSRRDLGTPHAGPRLANGPAASPSPRRAPQPVSGDGRGPRRRSRRNSGPRSSRLQSHLDVIQEPVHLASLSHGREETPKVSKHDPEPKPLHHRVILPSATPSTIRARNPWWRCTICLRLPASWQAKSAPPNSVRRSTARERR